MPGFKVKDRIRQISQCPLWAKLSAAGSLVFLAIIAKLLEDPAVAFRDWAGDFLFKQYWLPGPGLLLIAIGGWILGLLTVLLLQRTELISVSTPPTQVTAGAEQEGATVVKMRPQEPGPFILDFAWAAGGLKRCRHLALAPNAARIWRH